MRIYCPKCHTGYEIDEQQIADKSRRVECSSCGEIFTADELLFAVDKPETESENSAREAFDLLHEVMTENTAEDAADGHLQETDVSAGIAEDTVSEETAAEELPEETTPKDAAEVSDNAAGEEEAAEDEDVDLEKIFERLSEHTAHLLDEEKHLPFYEKFWLQVKNILGFHFKIKWHYIAAFAAVFVLISLFNNRYQVVRSAPFLNAVYKVFGIEAKIPGEGLEFQNINWEYFDNDEEGRRLQIKGFIYNKTDKSIEVPVVHIEILDKDTVLLQSQNREIEQSTAEPQTRIPLDLEIKNPAPTAKYVYLTFINKD